MPSSPRSRTAATLVVAAVVTCALVVGTTLLRSSREDPGSGLRPTAVHSLRAPRPEVTAARLLREWDAARAAAWADQDTDALLRLYRAGSSAGRRDQAMLLAWQRRGLRVEGLRTQVVRLTVLDEGPERLDLEVVDRLVGGVAVGLGVRHELPRDGPTTRRVVLVEEVGGWVVASVSAERSPASR